MCSLTFQEVAVDAAVSLVGADKADLVGRVRDGLQGKLVLRAQSGCVSGRVASAMSVGGWSQGTQRGSLLTAPSPLSLPYRRGPRPRARRRRRWREAWQRPGMADARLGAAAAAHPDAQQPVVGRHPVLGLGTGRSCGAAFSRAI